MDTKDSRFEYTLELEARCEKLRELADLAAAEQGLAQRRMNEAQISRNAMRRRLSAVESAAFNRGVEAMRRACIEWCNSWENDGARIAAAIADLHIEDNIPGDPVSSIP